MDAHALLSAQGWRGTGHSLHKTDDTIGLAKPLLLNRKDNTKGLGQKQHFTSDQWWMDAFDEQLKGLDTSKDGKVVQTITSGKLNSIEQGSLGKWALYTSFVKGGFLEGTLMSKSDEETSEDSGEDDDDGGEDKNSMANLAKNKVELATGEKETKEERKARRDERRRLKAERSARKEKKSKKSKEAESTNEETTNSSKALRKAEKLARRARKEEKRRKRAAKESKATKG